MAVAIAHYISAKIDYRKPEIQTYERYVFEHAAKFMTLEEQTQENDKAPASEEK